MNGRAAKNAQAKQIWWITASEADSMHPWHWRQFFKKPSDRRQRINWGGPEWINSPRSFASIEKMRVGDVVVAYQAREGVVGLALLATGGRRSDDSGRFDTFDLSAAPTVLLQDPISFHSIVQIPNSSKLFDAVLDLSKKINKPIESKNMMKISKSPDKIKVCIVDDDPSCVFTLKNLLMSCGVAESNIFFYYTGVSFLSSTQNFDLIFLDIIMPEMDGFDCARKFRLTNKTSIIIGISASIQAKDKELSYAVGMLNFIIKPITRNQIKNILDLFSG